MFLRDKLLIKIPAGSKSRRTSRSKKDIRENKNLARSWSANASQKEVRKLDFFEERGGAKSICEGRHVLWGKCANAVASAMWTSHIFVASRKRLCNNVVLESTAPRDYTCFGLSSKLFRNICRPPLHCCCCY